MQVKKYLKFNYIIDYINRIREKNKRLVSLGAEKAVEKSNIHS